MQHSGSRMKEAHQFQLVVSMGLESGWRAAVIGPDETQRVFVSPFELARYLAWPVAREVHALQGGIR